jgi:hypothetical protein
MLPAATIRGRLHALEFGLEQMCAKDRVEVMCGYVVKPAFAIESARGFPVD